MSPQTPRCSTRPRNYALAAIFSLLAIAAPATALAASLQPREVASVPGAIARAQDLGPIERSTPLQLTIWLTLHNKAEFDQRVQALYQAGSPSYHHWLTAGDLLAYAPSAADIETVTRQLKQGGLAVHADESNPFALRVSGSAELVQAAFGTSIHSFEKNGSSFHANVTAAHVEGPAASLILNIGGLHNIAMKPMTAQVRNPTTGKPLASVPLGEVTASPGGLSTYFTSHCFQTASSYTFGAPGVLPVGVFFGNVYNTGNKTCGYTAQQMQSVYSLPVAYAAGITGTGQTIAIVDGYGSSTIESDANQFNMLNKLPPFNASNFKVIYPGGMPFNPRLGEGWIMETSLDVEWAHAIAPTAKITLLAAYSGDDQDLQFAIQYGVLHHIGSVISASFGVPEVELSASDLDSYNQILEQAAAVGISVNCSSGDQADLETGSSVGTALAPADSPYGTAVGGTSLDVPGGTGVAKEVGWGNNETSIAYDTTTVANPPYNYGNVGGAGGGGSLYFAKAPWERGVPGDMRQDPDVALDADPYTGAIVMYTDPIFGQIVEAVGGTSLSTPMFSAFWALANEKAGHLLGQAGPILAQLPANALHDIVPPDSPTNVTGSIIGDGGVAFYTADELASPLQNPTGFTSAIWPIEGEFIDLTFGTDTSLKTAKGWDDVTGYGSPAGYTFIEEAARE